MAITKTSRIQSINVHYWDTVPVVEVHSLTTWDDPDDDQLPITNSATHQITKMTETTTYDAETGDPVTSSSATDYSGEDAKVIAICDLVWAD